MALEIEAKMALADGAGLEKRLTALAARPGRAVLEINTFFDTPQSTLRAADQGLRLRVERPWALPADGKDKKKSPPDAPELIARLTHKGPRAHGRVKTRAETEITVSDPQEAARLLKVLGYAPVFSFEKRRRTWTFQDCTIAWDTLPYLGDYVEIEGPSEAVVLQVREQLGLADAALIQASYIAMLATYLSEHHISSNRATFNGQHAT